MQRQRGQIPNSQRIRELRQLLGWTQQMAAKKAGVSVKLIRKAENHQAIDIESFAILEELFRSAGQAVATGELMLVGSERESGAAELSTEYPILEDWLQRVWAAGDWDYLESCCAPQFLFHCRVGTLSTITQLRAEIECIRRELAPTDIQLQSKHVRGSMLIGRWTATMQRSPTTTTTSALVVTSGVTTLKLYEGKIIEAWEYWHPRPIFDLLAQQPKTNSSDVLQLPTDLGTPIHLKGQVPKSFTLNPPHLRLLRQRATLTQEDAARKMGISLRAYRKAEAGEPVNARTVAAIALGLTSQQQRVTPDELLVDPSAMSYHGPAKTELGRRVQAWFDAQWNHPAPERLAQMATSDFVYHMEHGIIRGPQELKERNELFRQSFGDIRMTAEEICDFGDAFAVRWHCEMTHVGPWLEIHPSGCRVVIRGSSWVEMVGDKFGDAWDFWDPAVIYSQLLRV